MKIFNKKSASVKKETKVSVIKSEKLEIEQLYSTKMRICEEKNKIESQIEEFEIKNKELHKMYNDLEYKCQRRKVELSNTNIEINNKLKERDALENENINGALDLKAKKDKIDSDIQTRLENIKKVELDIMEKAGKLKIEYSELAIKIDNSNKKLQVLHDQSQTLSENLREKNNSLKIREAEIEKVDKLLKNKIEKSDDERRTLSEINEQKDKIEHDIINKNKILADLKIQVKEKQEKLILLEERMIGFAVKEEKISKVIPKLKKYCKLAGIKNPFD